MVIMPRAPLRRHVIGKFGPVLQALLHVATGAVVAQGGSEESHGFHEFVDGNSFKDLDVLEELFGHQRLGIRGGLALSPWSNEQQQGGRAADIDNGSFHVLAPCDEVCISPSFVL